MRGEWQQRKTTTIAIRTLDIVFSRLHGHEGKMCHVFLHVHDVLLLILDLQSQREGAWKLRTRGIKEVISGHGWEGAEKSTFEDIYI